MWDFIGIVVALGMATLCYAFAAEIATDWMYEWHHDWQERFKPVKTAYRAHINRHSESRVASTEEDDRD